MPFTETQELRPDPLVRIFFSGQLILAPADSTSSGERNCEVFINRSAANHQFTVEARQKRPRRPDVILMRHSGLLPFATRFTTDPKVIHGMLIGIDPSLDLQRGVNGYVGATTDEGRSLNEALSLARIHSDSPPTTDLTIDAEVGRPSILLNDATLYSADLTALRCAVKKPDGTTALEPRLVASLIGANIYPTDDQGVLMRWNQNGVIVDLPFPPPEDGEEFTYEVYVSNDPPFDPATLSIDSLSEEDLNRHDELKEYYKMLPSVPTTERRALRVLLPEATSPTPTKGTPRTLCTSLIA